MLYNFRRTSFRRSDWLEPLSGYRQVVSAQHVLSILRAPLRAVAYLQQPLTVNATDRFASWLDALGWTPGGNHLQYICRAQRVRMQTQASGAVISNRLNLLFFRRHSTPSADPGRKAWRLLLGSERKESEASNHSI